MQPKIYARPRPWVFPCLKKAVTAETAGLGMTASLGMTATGVIGPVLWAARVRVEVLATLMAFQPNFWKIWELTDPFTQGK